MRNSGLSRRVVRLAVGILGASVIILTLAACGQSQSKAKSEAGPPAKQAAQPPAVIQGTVEYVQGDVTINGAATQIGRTVNSGDTVKTGGDGICEITFEGKNIVQIQVNSLAVLNFGEIGRGIQLQSGSIAAVLKNLAATQTANRFQVDTPTNVAGIRGTSFFVKVLSQDSTYFCLCNGRISLQDNSGGNQMTLETAHHWAVEYVRRDGKVTVEKQALRYHNDAEMQALASKIGYTIDWTKPDLVN